MKSPSSTSDALREHKKPVSRKKRNGAQEEYQPKPCDLRKPEPQGWDFTRPSITPQEAAMLGNAKITVGVYRLPNGLVVTSVMPPPGRCTRIDHFESTGANALKLEQDLINTHGSRSVMPKRKHR